VGIEVFGSPDVNDTVWSPDAGDYDEATLFRVGRLSGGSPYLQNRLAMVWRNKQTAHPSWEVVLYLPHRQRVAQTFSRAEEAKAYAIAVWRLDYA
jgi:hypothetical protein